MEIKLKKLLLVLLLVVAAVIGWGVFRKSAPPRVNFTRVKRETLVSTLSTNGKAEPSEWQAVRAEAAGLVSRVPVREGQTVAQGAVLAEVSDPSLEAGVAAGEAKVAEAKANLAALQSGGKPAELADIENRLAQARAALEQAERDSAALERLAQKQAATAAEAAAARDKVNQARLEIAGLDKRRGALVANTDIAAAQARLQDAAAALNLAKQQVAQSLVRAPLAGEVYGLAVRAGSYLNPGDLVANVGRLDRLRVRVYVDEPELGRVAEGQPVTITWQALPGKQWQGTVVRKPTSIEALGSRQVGQVDCTIANPERELIPGTNVDAVIRTAVAGNALVIPKETLRHDAAGDYVFLLAGDRLERRAVKTANSSVAAMQVVAGLAEGDQVAMPSDVPLTPGARVTPITEAKPRGAP
ncbi:MAG: efflux RND transporter periplasmic adaptor subunit [Acidobacteriia bacterium]|nr:efflux RND transporter periplasmic adaptor subunit [Terriglobia bacterium]